MSRTDLFGDVEAFLRSHRETKMEMEYDAAIECRCGIHRAVVHSDKNGVGCEQWAHGSMRSIAALYEPGYVRYCHAEPGQRVLDVKMARLSVSGVPLAAYLGNGMKPVMKYVKGGPVQVKYLGAGFCYSLPFLSGVRVRVARVLGPKGFGLDILRLVRVVGAADMPAYRFEEVKPGLWHLEEVEGPRVPTAMFVEELLQALEKDPALYVGVSAEVQECLDKLAKLGVSPDQLLAHVAMGSFSQWKYEGSVVKPGLLPAGGLPLLHGPVTVKEDVPVWAWLKQRGFELSPEALGYLQLLKLSPSDQATLVDKGRDRLKMLAVVGDAILDMSAVSMVLGIDGQGADFDRFRKKCQNSDLAVVFDRLGLAQVVAGGSPKNKADTFEALMGIVVIFQGFELALKMCRQFVFEVNW